MAMIRWDCCAEMTSLRQAMDRLSEDTFMWPARSQYEMDGTIYLRTHGKPSMMWR